MTKTQLVEELAKKLKVSKKMASDIVAEFTSSIISGVKKTGEVRIQGFGIFKVSKRGARNGVNPRTGAKMQIEARNIPAFKAGAEFKKALK